MTAARVRLAILVAFLSSVFAIGQEKDQPRVKEPARAEKLDIQIRYRIRADRDERIRQFRVLEKHLASLGFEDSRRTTPTATSMCSTRPPSASAARSPRNASSRC